MTQDMNVTPQTAEPEKYEAEKGEQQKNDYDNPAQDRGSRMPHDARLTKTYCRAATASLGCLGGHEEAVAYARPRERVRTTGRGGK